MFLCGISWTIPHYELDLFALAVDKLPVGRCFGLTLGFRKGLSWNEKNMYF